MRARGALLVALATALPAGAACSSHRAAPRATATGEATTTTITVAYADARGRDRVDVLVQDNVFTPQFVTISTGTTVVWSNWGESPHAIALAGSSVPAAGFGVTAAHFPKGSGYSYRFTAAGRYPYYCTIHGSPGGQMHGVVVVEQSTR